MPLLKKEKGFILMNASAQKAVLLMIVPLTILLPFLGGCSSAPPEKHYPLQGEIVAIGPTKKLLTVQHGDIPGFMPGMTMSYTVAEPKEVEGLKVGDKISADLVVTESRSRLEKILLQKPAPVPPAQPSIPANHH
jgi:Cu/Ag efflux protein CusF